MDNQGKKDWKQRLQDLEAEINQTIPEKAPQMPIALSERIRKLLVSAREWFNALPTPGKAVVVIGGGLAGLSLLNTVLHLVTSLLTIGALGMVIYLLYKFFVANVPENK